MDFPAVKFDYQNGKLTLDLRKFEIKEFITKLTAGYIRVQLNRPSKPRTTGQGSQSAHINGHVQQIANETGNEFDDVKTVAKLRAIKRGYPFRTIAGQIVPFSETEIDTVQAGALIDELHQIASEMEIRLVETEN